MTALVFLLLGADPKVVFGVRLDPFQSMQWSGGRICALSPDGGAVIQGLPVEDIWPGPIRGAFAFTLSDGHVGLLLDRETVKLARPFGDLAMLRSAHPHSIVGWIPAVREFQELRTGRRMRTLLRLHETILDFDLTEAGHLIYLTEEGETYLQTSPEIPALRLETPAPKSTLRRVFINAVGTEIVWYGAGRLYRLNLDRQRTENVEFDEKELAIVRVAESRDVRLERICHALEED